MAQQPDDDVDVIEQMNKSYRADKLPSEQTADAFQAVTATGEIDDATKTELIDELYDAAAEDTVTEPPSESALLERTRDGVRLRVSVSLWRQQPLGVICKPLQHRVNGEGSAVLDDVVPRSADVAAGVFPAEHVALEVVPLPVWLSRFVGYDGYPTMPDH